jgi:psiF repeat
MRLSQTITLSAILVVLGSGMSLAQSPKPDTPAPAAASDTDKKAVSKECSAQATAKGLRGKERKKFRADCKKSGGKPG